MEILLWPWHMKQHIPYITVNNSRRDSTHPCEGNLYSERGGSESLFLTQTCCGSLRHSFTNEFPQCGISKVYLILLTLILKDQTAHLQVTQVF